ncbi:MAG: FAD:protein FMN transferase [Pirellula sp.]
MSPLNETQEAYWLSIPAMGSVIDIRWIPSDQRAASEPSEVGEKLRAEIDRWVEVMSDYQQDSQVNQLCRDAQDGQWHQPSPELWRILMLCATWHRYSEGAFDASLGALTRLRRSRKQVSQSQWDQASKDCGWEHLQWDLTGRRLRFQRPGLRLDFGAIGKGFVVDRLGHQLRELGIDRYSVNSSGNIGFGDSPKPNLAGWPVAIGLVDDPDRVLMSLRLSLCGIATSGELHQKYADRPVDNLTDSTSTSGHTSSHILDPAKRVGLAGSIMATVVTQDATSADAFATSCCVHAARGTLRGWLARLEAQDQDEISSFEIWVQTRMTQDQPASLIHWHRRS